MMDSNQERLGIFPYQRRSTRLSSTLPQFVRDTPRGTPTCRSCTPCRFRSEKNQNNGTNPDRHPPFTFDCRPLLRSLPLTLVLSTTEHVQIDVSTARRRLPTDKTSVCPTTSEARGPTPSSSATPDRCGWARYLSNFRPWCVLRGCCCLFLV
jgi:hypothetical protein